tara:strand:- start:7096 stop:7686 length:591 start_codon:yes stop_codon:yes gene_type:complete
MIVQSLLSGLVLFTSFSMRTPNDESISVDDYEVSLGLKSENFYMKRDWERELGQSYIDDEIWFEYEPKNFYIKPQYVNKTSRDLQYGKADVRYRNGDYSIGYTGLFADDKFESGLSMGIQRKKEINDKFSMEIKWDGYYFRDELTGENRFDMEDYAQINWKISDKLILTNIFDYNDIKGRKYYKFKIGVEYVLGRD